MMKKDLFQYTGMFLAPLNVDCTSEVSSECSKVNQELNDNRNENGRGSRSVYYIKHKSGNPNKIIGLDCYHAKGIKDSFLWVSAMQTLAYTVYFENDADFATAADSKAMAISSNVFNFNEFIHANTELNNSLYC